MSLSGLDSDRILAYMDDIVVFSKTFEDHVCIFASDKVDFLGFELSRTGIKPQTRLTESTKSYKRPTTKKELRGFLGLAGFHRAFIPNFADISAPLNGLTNDKVPFIWTDMCEEAFVQLKMKLTSEPILKFPDLNQPFVVEVDASNYAVGGILSQKGSNVDGNIMQEICTTLGIEKRRSSAYHSQGNGFVERNIRSVKDMLRAVLLHRQLQQSKWRSILGSLVFALNTTISKATKCVPYEVVFGRPAVLPQDIIFGTTPDEFEHTSASDHLHAVSSSLNDVFEQVMSSLALKHVVRTNNNKVFFVYHDLHSLTIANVIRKEFISKWPKLKMVSKTT
eukprot:Seg2195.9 transcript_id=Seg2195.9/GoldUCD/mRNA.D3Y31 product="Retrovirus-related Pol polyprotein from transposon 17.6" pseudo=true protein_id=Seg2195.9/GoldUCD/D3Y31